jgi:beta-glucanase (GH16 family)
MKAPAILSFILLLHGTFSRADVTSAPAVQPYENVVQGYQLTWGDEFEGNALDTSKWDYRTDSKLWSTQLPANVSVSEGALKLALKKEAARGKSYTGGGIISKQTFTYGYYEARFKVPPGSGWHTSFWTMKWSGTGGTKPTGTQEIDICEQDSVKLTNYSAGVIAWGNKGKGIARKYIQTPNLNTDFHIWGCEFTPETVKFFFDGQLTHQADATTFKQGPQNIWLTCIASPYGHTWGVDGKRLPAVAEFDYVRYFTKTNP